jgi:hypothetical protein
MGVICDWVIRLYITVYLVALFLFLSGTMGWFGSNSGPLAGAFLAPLGLPWNRMLDDAPAQMLPWLASGAPAVNIVILNLLCSRFHR